jgi:prephenate dehydrogenase
MVGLGQIGGSIAKRLTDARAAIVTGYDNDPAVIRRARRMRVAMHIVSRLDKALANADIVVLAMPVSGIIGMLKDERVAFDSRSLVMDVGSTKAEIMKAADGRPEPLRFIGGHPLAGSEGIGLDAVNPLLFDGAPFALVKRGTSRSADTRKAEALVRAIGAVPLWISAKDHDRITGLTIGLPHVLAYIVRDIYEREASKDRRVQELAGGSIWSTMRVSNSDAKMVRDFIATNRDWIQHWWGRLVNHKR